MATCISETLVRKARKTYGCNGCEAIHQYGSFQQFCDEFKPSFSEMRMLVRVKKNGFKIHPGQPYIKQFNSDGYGLVWTYRSIPEIHNLCIKYKLYDNDY